MMSTRKLTFETSDLSKHPIKNLQTTINVLIDQKENEKEGDIEEVPEQSIQKKQPVYLFPDGSSKPLKGKEKDTRD